MKTRAKDTLLLIGDNDSDRGSLRTVFESKFYLLEAENPAQGILLLAQNAQYIAAVVTDVPLSNSESLQALAGACQEAGKIPLITIIQPSGTGENEEYAFILGADDVVLKPYTILTIQRRVQLLVDLYLHQWDLERLAQKQNEAIQRNHQTMIDTLSSIIEHRSTESGYHVLRIRRFTKVLLESLAQNCPEYGLDETTIDIITSAASLHDIGKISIPDNILNKPGKLTAEEYEIMKSHTTVGSQLVERLNGMGDISYLRYIYNITLYHHERWDGKGYPEGLAGDDIPICAQVVGLTDAFDALTSPRMYKPALPHTMAVNMILNGECGAFSPKLLECFKRVREELIRIAQAYADGYSPKSDDIRMPLPGPTTQSHGLDSLQLSQRKYHTLLHHLNDTVIEMDLDNHIYHVVYNPNPDFVTLFNNVTYEALPDRLIQEAIHPEDAQHVVEQYGEGMTKIFRQGARTFKFRCRMYSPPHQEYYPYEVTLQRIQTEDASQRMLLVVYHNLGSQAPAVPVRPQHRSLLETSSIYDISNATLCCMNDPVLTIREGIPSLLPLTGYQTEEIWTRFFNSLLELVAEEDQSLVLSKMRAQDVRGGRAELQCRLRHKDGSLVWVQIRSRASVGPDGEEYRYLTLTDINQLKQTQQQLEGALKRNALVLSQGENLAFEWDLAQDTITCSQKWEERFGYSLKPADFSRQLQEANHFHPDDLPLLRLKARAMQAGKVTDVMDARIANSEGLYYWTRIRATTVFDKNGHPTHVVGAVYDIDQLKTDALSMQQQAQRDSLTKLLNKSSAQSEITDYLKARHSDAGAAMLVLDLDNFKTVNDSLGHFYGDAVLNQVGTTLKNLFRAQDVVGRIGGDEFMILLKDVPTADIVRERCKLLVETFQAQFHKLMPNLPVSVSVGAAMAPQHGSTYEELYRLADEALYSAKRRGKNQFNLYDPQDKYETLLEPGANATRIDSDFRNTLSDDKVLPFIFQCLYDSRDLEVTINELLGFIGTHFNVSRVYIFENTADDSGCCNTFEWCNVGIEPQIDNLQFLSYETDIPNWPSVYNEEGILYCTDVSELEPLARSVVEPQGIKSMLHCSIRDQGVFKGFVGFDECTANYLWTQTQVSMLKVISSMLSVFITKLRLQQAK